MGCALSKNIETMLIMRLLAGMLFVMVEVYAALDVF
jgi:hypothetical protein